MYQASTIQISEGGNSIKLEVSGVALQSPALGSAQINAYIVTPEVDVFVRLGLNPTAVSDGTDQLLLARNQYRVHPIPAGYKISFITSGAIGNVYITPAT